MTPEQQVEFLEIRISCLRRLNENYLETISMQHKLIQTQGVQIVRFAIEKQVDS